jgi:hypothetical protein
MQEPFPCEGLRAPALLQRNAGPTPCRRRVCASGRAGCWGCNSHLGTWDRHIDSIDMLSGSFEEVWLLAGVLSSEKIPIELSLLAWSMGGGQSGDRQSVSCGCGRKTKKIRRTEEFGAQKPYAQTTPGQSER